METNERDKLIAYHDGLLKPEEKLAFEELLKSNPSLADELAALRLAEIKLRELPFSPSSNFSTKVMAAIRHAENPVTNIRRNLMVFFGVIVVTMVGAFMLSEGAFDSAVTTVDLPEMSIPEVGINQKLTEQFSQPMNIDWKNFLTVILFINLALAFIILDRTVLKPFFRNRQHSY